MTIIFVVRFSENGKVNEINEKEINDALRKKTSSALDPFTSFNYLVPKPNSSVLEVKLPHDPACPSADNFP